MHFPILFMKMSGTGNDFIVIDNRHAIVDKATVSSFAAAVCRRKFSVGADGLILIEPSSKADFSWTFLNGDGSLAEMCGNGARCAARFAYVNKIAPALMKFETLAGTIEAEVVDSSVKIRLTPPTNLKIGQKVRVDDQELYVHHINTGVPHTIHFVDNNDIVPIDAWGRSIRFDTLYQPAGTNVNFVKVLPDNQLYVRTYERGVEGETMACGTGAVAAAIVGALYGHVRSPVEIKTSGGEMLKIHFHLVNFTGDPNSYDISSVQDVFLEGPARFVYTGHLDQEALG